MKCRWINTSYDDVLSRICCALLIILVLSPPVTFAAEWDFNPRLTVSETYTDNVRLGAAGLGGGGGGFGGSGNQGGDFITQINPGIIFTGVGRRFNIRTNYTMNNLIFAQNSNFSRIRHQLNASATTEIIKDFFFIDGMARRLQQNASLIGPQAVDNTNVTGNRIDIRAYNISPYLRYRFKRLASTELRYTRGIIESNLRNGLRNSQRDSFQYSLNSGSAFRTLQWGLNYSKNIIHFTRTNREIKMDRSIANLRYNLTSQFALTATGGYENNDFGSASRRNLSAPSWTVGFFWAPTQRTDINLAAGKGDLPGMIGHGVGPPGQQHRRPARMCDHRHQHRCRRQWPRRRHHAARRIKHRSGYMEKIVHGKVRLRQTPVLVPCWRMRLYSSSWRI